MLVNAERSAIINKYIIYNTKHLQKEGYLDANATRRIEHTTVI